MNNRLQQVAKEEFRKGENSVRDRMRAFVKNYRASVARESMSQSQRDKLEAIDFILNAIDL